MLNCWRWLVHTALCLFVIVSANLTWADVSTPSLPRLEPERQHATTSQRITNLFTRTHYHQFDLNDQFSERIFLRYLRLLDPQRLFFTQKDLQIFERYRYSLDDDLRRGRLEPVYEMYNLNMQRRSEKFLYALRILSQPLDKLRVGKTHILDRSELPWASEAKELDLIWQKRLMHEYLDLKVATKDHQEALDVLQNRYKYALQRLQQGESEDVFQLFMNAFARTIEPHTSYLSPRIAERFKTDMNLSLEGIGAVLQSQENYIVIRSLVPGGPAALSKNLKPNDKIVSVAQGDGHFVDVMGRRLDRVVDLIKGPKGSVVRLQVLSEGSAKPKIVKIVRDEVHLDDRAAKSYVRTEGSKKVGVLEIPSFYVKLHQDVKKELENLVKQGIDGLVVDLRENGGGELGEATKLTGLFIGSGPVVQIRDASGRVTQNIDRDQRLHFKKDMVVLVSQQSASASEIFAAAMQDYGRALIVGEQTFGKGTVQQHHSIARFYDFYEKPIGHVQYTIAKFYRVTGGSTQHKGVVPDIIFPSLNLPENSGESVEENALAWDKIDPVKYKKYSTVSDHKKVLLEKHQKRIQTNPEFIYLNEDIKQHREHQQRKEISLVESERIQRVTLQEALAIKRLNERLHLQGFKPVASLEEIPEGFEPPDPFLTESIRILTDLLDIHSEKIVRK